MGTTINQDFYHTVLVDIRLGFHITDWLSIAGFGAFAAANIETGFRNNVVGSLGDTAPVLMREPMAGQAAASMQKVSSILGAQLEFTPFTGKYSMFGKLFAAYDVYLFFGPGFINVSPATTPGVTLPDCGNNNTITHTPADFMCSSSGLKFGANFGAGFHSYFTQWLALDIELRDLLAQLNPSGRDVNGDQLANNKDLSWLSTFVLTANLSFYLPTHRQDLCSDRRAVVPSPKKKVTLYFSAGMLGETQREAIRQDRSISWIIQAAWRLARAEVHRLPGYGQSGASSGAGTTLNKRQIESL